jgi:hypothetical protein
MASIHQNLPYGNSYFRPFRHDAKDVIFLDIRCRLPTDIYGQPFVNMKLDELVKSPKTVIPAKAGIHK